MRSLLNRPVVFDNNVYYYTNIITNPKELISRIERSDSSITDNDMISKWKAWNSSDGVSNFGLTKSIDIDKYKTSSEEIKYIYGNIISAIQIASRDYSNSISTNLGIQSPLSISKYYEGQFMGPHTDEKTGAHISGVLYLNDEYSGGELGFPNQEFFIKPRAGSMIIFPSTDPYVHDPQPAYGAERYICPVFWYK